MARVIFSVINDVSTDKRVDKIALTLQEMGHQVTIVGRKLRNSPPVSRSYHVKRMRLIFNKKVIFYIAYNIRLFFFLLFSKVDILVANDLDTLLPNFLAAKLKRKKIIYDSHEFFTEVPELIGRRLVKSCWLFIEKLILPRIKYAYTVSEPIAETYREKYGIQIETIKNLPHYIESLNNNPKPNDQKIILYQGALNMGRGIELVIKAMKYLPEYKFIVVGDGDITSKLKALAAGEKILEKIIFTGRLVPEQLSSFTKQADVGISLEEDMGLNYRYALPNKLFDYIQNRIPVLVSDLPEMKKIVKKFQVGEILKKREPEKVAQVIKEICENETKIKQWKKNADIAAKELCWEIEKEKIIKLYAKVLNE